MTEPSDRQDEIDETAALWVARLAGGPLDAADRRALEQWLAEDASHAGAFTEAQAALGMMDAFTHTPDMLQVDLPPPAPASSLAPAQRTHRWRRLTALAASAMLLIAGALLWTGDPLLMMAADHRTAPAERRTVTLPDGSVVELGPASAIALRYDDEQRKVELLSGVAYFIAAPRMGAEQRPFVVAAASGTARALGTQFAVDRFADSVEVVVVEHEVAVAVADPNGQSTTVVLSPGQSVRYAADGLATPRATNLDQALAWRRDRLVFDHVPLGDVVSELNRYRRGKIVIGSSSLAQRQVSGVFDAVDTDAALAAISRELGARTASAPLVTVLY